MRNHIIKKIKLITLLLCIGTLTACSLFDKDNTPTPTPLTTINIEVHPRLLWSIDTGAETGDEYLKMSPTLSENAIYTSGISGIVSSINVRTGRLNWQTHTNAFVSSGPGVGNGMVVVGTRQGDVIALSAYNGKVLWKKNIAGEILAKPAIGHGIVVIKAVDGTLHGLSAQSGKSLWMSQQEEPNLVLRGASTPVIRDGNVITGFANGNLAKFNLYDGMLDWKKTIAVASGAFAIQRMIDIDADPIVYEHHIYVATYQGNIDSLDWNSGQTLWSHDISSYTGMSADKNSLFVTDAKGHVWAFNANSGLVNWRQIQLESRILSSPVNAGNVVVVGDAEGYLHWLSKQDGHIMDREYVGGAIYASPQVKNNVLYAINNKGYLVAYTLT